MSVLKYFLYEITTLWMLKTYL